MKRVSARRDFLREIERSVIACFKLFILDLFLIIGVKGLHTADAVFFGIQFKPDTALFNNIARIIIDDRYKHRSFVIAFLNVLARSNLGRRLRARLLLLLLLRLADRRGSLTLRKGLELVMVFLRFSLPRILRLVKRSKHRVYRVVQIQEKKHQQ